MRKILILLVLLIVQFSLFGQMKKKLHLRGLHGTVFTDFTTVNKDYLKDFFSSYGFPSYEIYSGNGAFELIYLHNRVFTRLSSGLFHSAVDSTLPQTDIWKTKYNQYFGGVAGGYNLVARKFFTLSPYLEFRFYRYRHVTYYEINEVTLDTYITFREIDVRLWQFTMNAGINVLMGFGPFTLGFYMSYSQNIHKRPLMYTKQNRITTVKKSPFDNLNYGVGIGFGVNKVKYKYRKKRR